MAEQFPVDRTELSSKEVSALEKFREIAAELPNMPEKNDRYYLRWLRARKFDVPKAVTMLRKVSDHSKSSFPSQPPLIVLI